MKYRMLTEEQRLARKTARKAKRRARGDGFFQRTQETISGLVHAAERLMPQDGRGPERLEWVIEQAVKFVRTPAGDVIERAVLTFLVEAALDARDAPDPYEYLEDE